ncbi:hypothetical protein HUO13_24180 [Saccharopolyspora erythraea]|uniref:hypothetical protein n=1 Tax=Saccharopolyspora erythraea TaxID=1836 RepID=UPI001BAB7231|nr:hypothetical protein [Saccharopolyspora erythraea]QUH03502.1 hypothetical protein HUO13_24180 [Saccharopolyspora erythraea]
MSPFSTGWSSGRRPCPAAVTWAVGFLVTAAVTVPVAELTPWSGGAAAGLAAMAFVVGLYGAATRSLPGAMATSATAWMFFDGFVVHSRGDLAWTGDDVVRLGVLAGAAVVGCLLGRAIARVRARAEAPVAPSPRPIATAKLLADTLVPVLADRLPAPGEQRRDRAFSVTNRRT